MILLYSFLHIFMTDFYLSNLSNKNVLTLKNLTLFIMLVYDVEFWSKLNSFINFPLYN